MRNIFLKRKYNYGPTIFGEQLHDPYREPISLCNWGKRSLRKKKIQGFNGIRTHDLREYRCDVSLTELRSHKLGASSVFVGSIFPIKEIDERIYEIILR